MKTCFKCNRCLPLDDFYRHSMMADGRLGKCKNCARRDGQVHREKHREQHIAYDAERYRNGRRPERRSPEQRRAAYCVSNALRDGRLVKPSRCQDCHDDFPLARIHAHHEDYNKPLDVIWVCHPCHGKRHRMPVPF